MHNKGTNQRNSALIVVLHLKATMGVLLINTILRITHDILKKHVQKRDISGGGGGEEVSADISFSTHCTFME
jgi:hypothetical protein